MFFFAYVTFVTLLPPLTMAFYHGTDASWAFITGDAFLYLGIAVNSPTEFYSYDGERPTNGFHPFWQYFVWLITDIFRGDPQLIRNIVAWSAIFLVWIGAVLGGLAARRMSGSWALACMVSPGVYFLLIGQSLGNLSVWNFFDAMEVGLTFALAGAAMNIASQAQRRQDSSLYWLSLGVALAALVFARLDEVFVVLAIGAALLFWPGRGLRNGLRDGLIVAFPVALMLVAYFAYNLAEIGILMPISGSAKGEGALVSNGWVTLLTLFSPAVELREALTGYIANRSALREAAFRVLQLCVPAGLAALLVFALLRFFVDKAWAPILAGACGGVVVKALYNFIFVGYWHQASWYFGFAVMVLSVTSAAVLGPALLRLRVRAPEMSLLVGVFLITFGLFHASHRALSYSGGMSFERMYFWNERAVLEARLRAAVPDIRMLDFGDGMLGYTFEFPVRHGFVFAGDVQSLQALGEGRLLRESYADGFGVLASYEYLRVPPEAADWNSGTIREYLAASHLDGRVKNELQFFDFSIIFVDTMTGIAFITFTPREGPPV